MRSPSQRMALCPTIPTLHAAVKCISNVWSSSSWVITFNAWPRFALLALCAFYLDDFCRLLPLLQQAQLGSAVPLIISDVNGDLRGLQPLEAVALTAAPLIDSLQGTGRQDLHVFISTVDVNTQRKHTVWKLFVCSIIKQHQKSKNIKGQVVQESKVTSAHVLKVLWAPLR